MALSICYVFLALVGLSWCEQYVLYADDQLSNDSIIGIALTVDHATVSIRHSNGSFEDWGRVEAKTEYIDLMHRLSLPSSSHASPPYHNFSEAIDDKPRQWWRQMRKRVGLLASSDVAILAEFLDNVAQAFLRDPKTACISFPDLPALYQEDILDAASFIGVTILPRSRWDKLQIPRHVAAYAGHGLGLCPNKTSPIGECPGVHNPSRHVVLFDYTETALLLHYRHISIAYVDQSEQLYMNSSFSLGSANSVTEGDIRDFVLQFIHSYISCYEGCDRSHCPEVVTVIMTGNTENYRDGIARKAVENAVEEFGSTAEMFTSNPDYVAARGAAQLAWQGWLREYKLSGWLY